ncbi:MAG: hypothetical protein ABJF04_06240 [Reichenbachiella sp.]|uniref:hypothetical protein n=1 Tax=Reichenbachiella sp. TaxID=2184521 RepID=UPI003264F340
MDFLVLFTSFITALVTGLVTFLVQERRLKKEFEKELLNAKTEHIAEKTAKYYLSDSRYTDRSFEKLKKRLGGFNDDELRKILVRAGAVRFFRKNDTEWWTLVSRLDEKNQKLGRPLADTVDKNNKWNDFSYDILKHVVSWGLIAVFGFVLFRNYEDQRTINVARESDKNSRLFQLQLDAINEFKESTYWYYLTADGIFNYDMHENDPKIESKYRGIYLDKLNFSKEDVLRNIKGAGIDFSMLDSLNSSMYRKFVNRILEEDSTYSKSTYDIEDFNRLLGEFRKERLRLIQQMLDYVKD